MAVAAIADDVEHEVGGEFLAELGGHLGTPDDGLGVVAVHMQDRRLDRLGNVGAIQAGIGMCRDGGEADLVVDDDMHGAAGAVADELAHRQRLVDQALAGEGRVAMHQDAHHRASRPRVARHVLPRADLADDDGIDRLEMRGVGLQREMHHVAGDLDVGRGAQMVFDVARTLHVVRLEGGAAEFAEQRGVGLLDDVHERVQAAAMRHADGDLAHAGFRRRLDDGVQRGDGDFAALEAEALGADEALLAEGFEALGLGQLLQDGLLGAAAEGVAPGRALDAALDPGLLVRVLDVHELDADRPAIGLAQHLQHLPRRRGLETQHVVDEDRPIHVGRAEAVGRGIEFRVRRRHLQAERIELGFEMAAHTIGTNHHQRPQAVLGSGAHSIARRG